MNSQTRRQGDKETGGGSAPFPPLPHSPALPLFPNLDGATKLGSGGAPHDRTPSRRSDGWVFLPAFLIHPSSFIIADGPIPNPPAGTFEPWMLNLCMTLAIVALVFTVAALVKSLFRKAPAPGLPQPMIITMKEQFVEKEEFDELKNDVHNRLKEMGAYIHEGMHGLKGDLQHLVTAGEEREIRLGEKLDAHWRDLTKERSASSARLYERIEKIDGEHAQEVSAIHKRVDGLADTTGKIGGGVEEMKSQLGDIRRLLMSNGGGRAK